MKKVRQQRNPFQRSSLIFSIDMHSLNTKRLGFTLVEMVVYAAILGVITVLAVNSTLLMVQAYTNLRVSRDLNAGATTVLERLTREIRGGDSVSTAITNQLILNTKDSGGAATTVEFYVESGLIKVREGGVPKGSLMPSSTSVVNFVPQALIGANSEAVKIDLTMSATRGAISKTRTFYTTVVIRGSY